MKILLTGATGMIGKELTESLVKLGHQVNILSRGKNGNTQNITYFQWKPERYNVDKNAFKYIDAIINLAGANVGEKRWNKEFKKEILESRTLSTRLLIDNIKSQNQKIKVFINASATGIYGNNGNDKWLTEDSESGNDFLATVVQAWEDELFNSEVTDFRKVALRLGIVLAEDGGALPKMKLPIKYGVGAPLASGNQYISWVDKSDVIKGFIFALENESMKGAYNLVSPNPITNYELTHKIAEILNRPILAPNIPAFALKLLLGEFADSVIGGSRVSSKKLIDNGFKFSYPELVPSLSNNLKKKS